MIDTNVKGLAYVTHAVLPGMVARNRGHVINIGSVASDNPYAGGNIYGATKAFVRQFTFNLRADLGGPAVRVTDVSPGMTAGREFTLVRLGGDEARVTKQYEGADPLLPERQHAGGDAGVPDLQSADHYKTTKKRSLTSAIAKPRSN